MPKTRFSLRQMCNLHDLDNLASWIIIDTRVGVPLADAKGIRTFTREEARRELERRNEAADSA